MRSIYIPNERIKPAFSCDAIERPRRSAEEFEGGRAGSAAVGDELKKGECWLMRGQFVPCESRWWGVVERGCL